MAVRWSQIQNINITEDEINLLAGLTATAAELNELTGFTGTSADLNNLLGLDTIVSNHIAEDFSTAHPIAANSLDGLIIVDNTITQSKLAFDVATQAELDAVSLLITNLTSDTAVQQTQIDNLYAIVIPGQGNDLADSIQQTVNHIEKVSDAHDSSAVSYGNYYTLPSNITGGVTSFLTIPWDQMKYYRVNDVIRFQDDITPFEDVTLTNVDYNLNRIYFNPPVSDFTVADNGIIWTLNELNAQQALDRSLKNNTDYFTGRLTIDQETDDQALVLNKTADGTTLEAYMLSIGNVAYFRNQGTGDALVLEADSGNDLHFVYGTIASDNGYVLDLLNGDLFRITNVGAGDRLVLNDSGDLTVTQTLLREEGTAFTGTITKDILTANRVWTFPDRDAVVGMPVYGLGDGLKVLRVNAGETDVEWHDLAAGDIDYDNSTSGLAAVLVQTAIDEIDSNLDTHINTASIHFIINDAGTALDEAWSSTKINNELSLKADATHNHTLDSLSNVNTAGKIAGSILEWNGTTSWIVGTKGEINTASNRPGDEGIFASKVGFDLQFKSLTAGSNISLSSDADTITISTSGSLGEANTASNVGGGEGIFKQKTLLDLEFKSLVAGANITLTPGADTITIASTGGGGGAGGTAITRNQVAHGFSVLDAIYHNGTIWAKAQANSANTLAEYVVTEVTDADNFVAYKFGEVEVIGHGKTVGEHYFLSDSVAGGSQVTEPSNFSSPLFYVEDANTVHIEVYRPSQVTDVLGDVVRYQTKSLVSQNGTGVKSSFNNLDIGRHYRVFGRAYVDGINSPGNFNLFFSIVNGATVVTAPFDVAQVDGQDPDRRYTLSFTEIFEATASTLNFTVNAADQLDSYNIKWTLEELPTHQATTDWT